MSSEFKYTWQEIQVSPYSVDEIIAQMEFLHKILDCDPHGRVIDLEERLAIHDELSRLNGMLPSAFDAEMHESLDTAAKLSSQHTNSSQPSFCQTSYEFRGIIWLTVFGLLIMFPMIPAFNKDLSWMFPIWFAFFLLDLVWAVWASFPLKE